MGLRFIDSFDHYTTFLQKWTSLVNFAGTSPNISAGTGRGGSASMSWAPGGNGGWAYGQKTMPGAPSSTLIFGFAWKISLIEAVALVPIMEPVEGTVPHLRLVFKGSTARLQVYRGGTLLGEGQRVLVTDTYYFIEFKVNIHDSTGSFEVRINEQVDFSASGIDTRDGGVTGLIDVIRFGSLVPTSAGTSLTTMKIDDLYVTDSTTYNGDCRVQAIFPTADAFHTAWTPSSGGTHFDDVDDAEPNEDTDYVQSSVVGQRDSWTYGDILPTAASVKGIQYMPRGRTDIEGARVIKPFYRLAGVDYDHPTGLALTTAYEYPAGFIADNNPSGGAWTLAQIQAAEFGVKVES
jgi:hypothetical protein